MQEQRLSPSMSWRREVFESDPVRDPRIVTKSTSVVPTYIPSQKRIAHSEGGIEGTALKILNFLQINGYVSRVKEQPFYMHEIGGPENRVPDILTELSEDKSLHIVQCKAKRFMTPEVIKRLEGEKIFFEPKGFRFHIWDDRNELTDEAFNSFRDYERGFILPLDSELEKKIELDAQHVETFGELLQKYGPDDCKAALSRGAFYLNLMKEINEKSIVTNTFSISYYQHLFKDRTVHRRWFDTLES